MTKQPVLTGFLRTIFATAAHIALGQIKNVVKTRLENPELAFPSFPEFQADLSDSLSDTKFSKALDSPSLPIANLE